MSEHVIAALGRGYLVDINKKGVCTWKEDVDDAQVFESESKARGVIRRHMLKAGSEMPGHAATLPLDVAKRIK